MSYHGTGYEIGKRISRSELHDLLTSYTMAEGVDDKDAQAIAKKTLEHFENLIDERMK